MNKKLYRVPEGKFLAGVCTGLAQYLNVDVTVIRLIWAVATLFAFAGLLAYIICIFIIPEKPDHPEIEN